MGIIKNVKVKYQSKALLKYVDTVDSSEPFSINLLDALQFAKMAWSEVTNYTITNCFCKAGFVSRVSSEIEEECSGDEEDESGLAEMWTRCDRTTMSVSLGDYLTAGDSAYTFGELIDSDIIHEVHSIFGASTAEENEDEEEEEDSGEEYQQPTVQETKNAMDTLTRYFYGTDVQDDCIFQKLDNIERILAVNTTKANKQASITDYFTPMQKKSYIITVLLYMIV